MLKVGLLGRLPASDQARLRSVGEVEIADLSELVRLEKIAGRPDAPAEATGASERLDAALADREVLFAWEGVKRLGDRTPALRWLQSTWAGVDFLAGTGIVERDVILTTGSGVTAPAIAEWTIGAIFALAKNFPTYARLQAERSWKRFPADDIADRTLLLFGLGAIGSEIAWRAHALGMRVLAVRRSPGAPPPGVDHVFGQDRLAELLPEADYLVLAAPLTPETHGLIGRAQIALLKPTARIINIARGALIDEPALIDALRENRIAGAILDVFEKEPLPSDSPFWDLPNVLVSPHISASNTRFQERLLDLFTDNLRRYLAGEGLRNVYERSRGY